jgi:hypothetical protein
MRPVVALTLLSIAGIGLGASFLEAPSWLRVMAATLALLWVPGACLVSRVGSIRQGALSLALALALSPVITGLVLSIGLWLGGSALLCSRILLLVCMLLAAFSLRRCGSESPSDASRFTSAGWPTLLLALLITATCAAPLVSSPKVRTSVHGFLHAAILYRTVDAGVPPENPFYAGEPLRYYWVYHVGCAALCELGSLEPVAAFTVSNMAVLLALLLALGAMGSALFGSRRAGLLAVWLGFFGLNPLGAGHYLLRAEGSWVSTLSRQLQPVQNGKPPLQFLRHLSLGEEHRITATLTKFMNVSSFPAALALSVLSCLLVMRVLSTQKRGDGVLVLFALLGTTLLSPLTGLTLSLILGGTLVIRTWGGHQGGGAALVWVAASVVLSLPWLWGAGAFTGEGKSIGFGPSWEKLQDTLYYLGPLLLLGLPGVRVARQGRTGGIFSVGLGLAILGVVLAAAVGNEYKLVRMAAPLLGVVAGGSLALCSQRGAAGTVLATITALAFLPTNALAYAAYHVHCKAPLPYRSQGSTLYFEARDLPGGEMYRWVQDHSPPDAILLTHPERRQRNIAGNKQGDEAAVLARRPIYSDIKFYLTSHEADFAERQELLRRVFAGERLLVEQRERLLELGRPIYLLVHAGDRRKAAQLEDTLDADPHWSLVRRDGRAALFELVRSE